MLALFIATKKALSNVNPTTLDYTSEILVFYDVFFVQARFPPRVHSTNQNPATATRGIGFIMILNPFGPAPLQILVLMKHIYRLNYLCFCDFHYVLF